MNDYLKVGEQASEQLKVRPWCRYWARTVDYGLYAWVVWIVVFITIFLAALIFGLRPSNNMGASLIIIGLIILGLLVVLLLGFFLLEAFFISMWGATPGKWLFKTQVTHADGSKLTFGEALFRSVQVFFFGMGLGFPFVSLVAHIWSCITLMDTGTTRWDKVKNYKVATGNVAIWRYVIGICLAFSQTAFSAILQVLTKLAQYSGQ